MDLACLTLSVTARVWEPVPITRRFDSNCVLLFSEVSHVHEDGADGGGVGDGKEGADGDRLRLERIERQHCRRRRRRRSLHCHSHRRRIKSVCCVYASTRRLRFCEMAE